MRRLTMFLTWVLTAAVMIAPVCRTAMAEDTAKQAESLGQFPIVGEWIWGSTVYELGADVIARRCAEMGITDLYLLVKGTGGTLGYLNTQYTGFLTRTDRDVLQEMIDAGHANGLRVHAWICNGQDSAYKAAYPDAGQYHYTRGRDNDNIALYNDGYVSYMRDVVKEIAAYDVDGLHLDYIRYNHLCNGWSDVDRANLEAMGANLQNVDYMIAKTFYQDRLESGDTVDEHYIFDQYDAGNPDALLVAEYRRRVVLNYASEIISAAKSVKPGLIITAALQPDTACDPAFGGLHYGNSYADNTGLYDYICPMAYSNVFGEDAAWMAEVARISIDQGNKVVMGLNSYYGNTGVTSNMLMADIEALRDMLKDEKYSESMLGIVHFRNTQFGYAKVSYDLNAKTMLIKVINGNPEYAYTWVQAELQEGLTAVSGAVVDGFTGDTEVVIAEDGSWIRWQGADILDCFAEGTLSLAYEGDLDVSKPAALVRIYLTNESRAYNVYENVTGK